MHVYRIFVSLIFSIFISQSLMATEFARCLVSASERSHRLEKEESLLECFNKNKMNLSREICFKSITQNLPKSASGSFNEQLLSICFYETVISKDVNSCLHDSEKFKITINHDEAIFYCYQQFQEKISKKECLKIANKLTYPLKKEYFKQYCERDADNSI